jgi:biotin carboxyl carrier protein
MPDAQSSPLALRIARLAEFLAGTDVVRLRIERGDEEIELAGRPHAATLPAPAGAPAPESDSTPAQLDTVRADLVGIVRFGRPLPYEGERLDGDRELAAIEALGIRTPIHSFGAGRIVTIPVSDGQAVEYGQPLFLIDRG